MAAELVSSCQYERNGYLNLFVCLFDVVLFCWFGSWWGFSFVSLVGLGWFLLRFILSFGGFILSPSDHNSLGTLKDSRATLL